MPMQTEVRGGHAGGPGLNEIGAATSALHQPLARALYTSLNTVARRSVTYRVTHALNPADNS